MASIMHNVDKNMRSWRVVFFLNILMLVVTGAIAQRHQRVLQLKVSDTRMIDGNLNDWGNELGQSYSAQGLTYELAQDGIYLYVALRVSDYERQVQALTRGVLFMVNGDGRKREGPSIIFPVLDRIGFRAKMSPEEGQERMEMRKAALESLRSIQVRSLAQIPDGPIALENDFGIAAAAGLDGEDHLCVEMRMPLELWGDPTQLSGKTLAYQLKINDAPLRVDMAAGRTRTEVGHWGQIILELN